MSIGDTDAKKYLCIQLKDNSNSRVFVPYSHLDDRGVREAISSFEKVRKEMFKTPRDLDDHYRTRQANIKERIDESGVTELIRGLRDLCWREYSDRLTNTDKKLRNKLQKRLRREIAVGEEMTPATAGVRIQKIINEAMLKHDEELGIELDD